MLRWITFIETYKTEVSIPKFSWQLRLYQRNKFIQLSLLQCKNIILYSSFRFSKDFIVVEMFVLAYNESICGNWFSYIYAVSLLFNNRIVNSKE